jgi:hypothetical protein
MQDLEKHLVELDLDIAKAKRFRREQKRELKAREASKQDVGPIEKSLKKTGQAIQDCKATRKEIIKQLLAQDAGNVKEDPDKAQEDASAA